MKTHIKCIPISPRYIRQRWHALYAQSFCSAAISFLSSKIRGKHQKVTNLRSSKLHTCKTYQNFLVDKYLVDQLAY